MTQFSHVSSYFCQYVYFQKVYLDYNFKYSFVLFYFPFKVLQLFVDSIFFAYFPFQLFFSDGL